jgi:hypothetical protein
MTVPRRAAGALLAFALLGLAAPRPVRAFRFDQIASDLSLTADEKAKLASGAPVARTVHASNERELAVGLAIRIPGSPDALAKRLIAGLALQEDPQVLARGSITTGAPADFAGVRIDADTARAYLAAAPGEALNPRSARSSRAGTRPITSAGLPGSPRTRAARGRNASAPTWRPRPARRSSSAATHL